jgi:hypothetical protein
MAQGDRRGSPRAQVALDVTLARPAAGAAVAGRTQDLGAAGMRVTTRRPLRLGEELAFDLLLQDATPGTGRAHVVRECGGLVYGLHFDRLPAGARERLIALAS